ncbi:MAG: S8 family serine peptidase [Solirubrobacteraceae bacterium]
MSSAATLIAALAILFCAPSNGAHAATVAQTPVLTMARAVNYSLTPTDFHDAYSLPKTGAAHQRIAIVSAYDDPTVQSDLNDYTKRFGIPACTVGNGCFRELNQEGQSAPLPEKDPTSGAVFASESSIGSEVARGVCQSCSILLVEANTPDEADISASVKTAIGAGATVVVTAFNQGAAEGDSQYAADYQGRHAVVVAASGDSGYSGLLYFPAVLPDVLAVGGTQLSVSASGQRLGETAWEATTSGCSLYETAPVWQAPFAKSVGCGGKRSVADLAAVAQPGALVHVQEAGSPCGNTWCEADGTSVAAPIIAGVIGLAGSDGSGEARMLYQHFNSDPGALHDITSGSNGAGGCTKPICSARKGYDGPTGLGTPDGLGAFLRSGGAVNRSRPGLTITSPRRTINVTPQWTAALTLRNDNPFAVSGSIALRQTSGSATVTFAARRFELAPLAKATQRFTVAAAQRALLTRLRVARVSVALQVRAHSAPTVTTARIRELAAP